MEIRKWRTKDFQIFICQAIRGKLFLKHEQKQDNQQENISLIHQKINSESRRHSILITRHKFSNLRKLYEFPKDKTGVLFISVSELNAVYGIWQVLKKSLINDQIKTSKKTLSQRKKILYFNVICSLFRIYAPITYEI